MEKPVIEELESLLALIAPDSPFLHWTDENPTEEEEVLNWN